MIEILFENQFVVGAIVWWLLSTAIRALPKPEKGDSKAYRWFYSFSHGIGANWNHFKDGLINEKRKIRITSKDS